MDLLGALLLTFMVFGVLLLVAVLLAVLLGTRALRRRNRVSPQVATVAPTSWVGAPSAGARMHRRLRAAVQVARASAAAAPSAPRLAELAAELEQEATALDRHLVVASRLTGKDGRTRMAALGQQVRRVEQLASQLSLLGVQAQAPMVTTTQRSALDELAHQLDALEAAREEVAQVESDVGLGRSSPFAAPSRPSPRGRPSPGV